jgi:hypothetical protein
MIVFMRNWRTCSLAFALCLVVTTSAVAQHAFVQVTTITVKPSGVSDFEDYVKKINVGATKIAAPGQTLFLAMGRGGRNFTYFAVSPFGKWSDLDAQPSIPEILIKAYGEVEGARLLKAGRANIEGVETSVSRLLPDLSSPPTTEKPAAHVRIVTIDVKAGTNSSWEAHLAKLKAAQDKGPNAPHVIRHVSVLGMANQYTSVYFFDKYAEADSMPTPQETLRKAYGDAEAKLLEETAQRCINSLHSQVLDFRADLSRLGPAPAPK